MMFWPAFGHFQTAVEAEMLEEKMEKKRKEEEQLIREARWGPRRGRRRS